MNQDTGWYNSYDKCGPDQRNHPPSRYNNAATMPQPNQQPRWEPLCLPPPVGIGHNIQSLHPYGGGFIPNQFHPAYTPRPIGSYQTYAPQNPSYNYRNNQNPRMRHGNNNSRWQRRNGQDRSRTFSNYQHSAAGPSKQEPKIQEIKTEVPEQSRESQSEILDVRPETTSSPASSVMSIHIIEDDDDNVGADNKPKIKQEDKKLLMECIDLSDENDSPEEALNKFEFESRTKILDKLCGTIDEAKFIEGLKQFKMVLKNQMGGIRLKNQLTQMLMKYILFLGMNYKSLASGFVEEYLDLMEDVIAMFCQVVTDFTNMQIADNKRTYNELFAFQIKQLISCALLFRLDSIMHCLFKIHLPPLYMKDHSVIWTDVFLYFLRKSKFDPKHDDLLRLFVAWKRLLSIRNSEDAEIINGYMFESLKKTPEELKSLPYLKEFMEKYHDNPRFNTREMLNKYWKWWKDDRPKQLWAGLEEPTYIQLHGTFNLEYQSTNVFLNHSSSKTQDDEFSKLFEDRRTGKTPGLTQLGRRMPYGRQNNVFCPSISGNIFDDSTCIGTDFDYYDDNDLIIEEPRIVETVVVDSDDDDGDDDDVIFIGDEQESNAQEVISEVEKTTEAVEKLMEESNINDNICEDDTSGMDSNKELVDEELIFNPKTSLEVEVQPDNETSKNNLEETDESKNEAAIEEICDSFVSNYPEDNDENIDSIDFPNVTNEPEKNQHNLTSTASSDDDGLDAAFDWDEMLDHELPEISTRKITEDRTLMFADPPPKSPEEFNFDGEPEITCDESSKTETVSLQKEIVPEKSTDSIPNDMEELPDQQQELESRAETSAITKRNGSLSGCMPDIREIINTMEKHYTQSQEEKNLGLTEVPLILEEPLLKPTNLSADSDDLPIEENGIEPELTDEEDNFSHNYAAIVQAACSDGDNNEFPSRFVVRTNIHNYKESNGFEDEEPAVFQPDVTYDSDEISLPLDSNEVHFDSEKQCLENESFEKLGRFESMDLSSAVSETLATASTEPIISPEGCLPDSAIFESCQKVIKDKELFDRTSTEAELTVESTSTPSPINLASPCHNNSDTITIKCKFSLSLKEEPNVEVQPTESENFVAMDENYELEKYTGYPLEVPQRQNSFTEAPHQSGSQPYSPPSIRIGNAASALDENSTMLYTPILQDSQKIQPAVVPDVLPQQDLPIHNAVPEPETSDGKLVETFKIVKAHKAPVVETPSSSTFVKESDNTYMVVYGSKTSDNSQTTEVETSEKLKKRSRRSSDSVKSKKKELDPSVSKGRKSSKEKLVRPQDSSKKSSRDKPVKPLSPQDNSLFEYAFEGPTGKPLWNTTPNMLWDDNEDPLESQKPHVLVKSDKQLVSILKKPKVAKDRARDYNQPQLIDESVSKNEATKKNPNSLHYPLSHLIASPSTNNFINNTSLSQTIESESSNFYSNLHFPSPQVYLSADNPKLTPASQFLPEEMLEINSKKLEEPAIVLAPEQYQEPYLSLSKTLFGDSLPTNESNNTFLEMQKITEDLPINNNSNFNVYESQIIEKQPASIYPNPTETYTNQYYQPAVSFYEPAITQNLAVQANSDIKITETQKPLFESSVVYQAQQALPQSVTLPDSKVTSMGLDYFVKAQLPPKKRKLTEEDELAYYIQKLKEEKEAKPKLEENISYPAQRQMSIADVQRDFPKGVVKTLAARKIYPGDPSVYPDSDYYEYPQGYDQYNDFNNKRSIMNVYINGVRDYSAKYPFCLMIGMGTAGQPSAESGGDEAAELPLNYQVPVPASNGTPAASNVQKPIEEAPAAQPRSKRAKKTESVASETPTPPKRGRGRPRKNPII